MRSASIYYDHAFAGTLTETDEGMFTFAYDPEYVLKHPGQYLTFSMPVTGEIYKENRLFPFFEGLIPEGWLLDIASKSWKINRNDRMGLLLACCENCIGAYDLLNVTIVNPEDSEELALTLEGKKRKLTKAHFVRFGEGMGLNSKQINGVFRRFFKNRNLATQWIDRSFLSDGFKASYVKLLDERYQRLS